MTSPHEAERPHINEHGGFPSASANSFRNEYMTPADSHPSVRASPEINFPVTNDVTTTSNANGQQSETVRALPTNQMNNPQSFLSSTAQTAVPSPSEIQKETFDEAANGPGDENPDNVEMFAPLKTNASSKRPGRLGLQGSFSRRGTEDDLYRTLSKKTTNMSDFEKAENQEQLAEIEKLMTRMFGRTRQANSEDEQNKHVGLVFRNLSIQGVGLGAALQPTLSDPFLALPRLLSGLFSGGISRASSKPPTRTIINDFSGCVRPGEMLLVLGRPGSGCSTFLKVLANQRYGYEKIDGDVTYGGENAETMKKRYRGEVLYNPEDDLHYATLTVKRTLEFALKTKTPGESSRHEGESPSQYVAEFLRMVLKLFWIEHTVGTKVGNEFVRGVSGGEKKRVSIAEAMITRASTQCWDNSTRGLDASTALEYVEALRTLTNMAHISTCIALYQAGESLYDLFDKVILIDEGKCLYYGPTDKAAAYFENLGFERPARWTTADFLTSVTDPHERKVRQGAENRIPRSADQFEAAYRGSDAYVANLRDIEGLEQIAEAQRMERVAAKSKAAKEKNYSLPFHKQVWACTHRQFLVMFGDQISLGGKWGGILFQALIVGSLFYKMPRTSSGVFTRGGVLFFMLLFNALLALAELTSAFSSRPILQKHKSFSFYRPAAYAIAQTVVDLPLSFIQVLIFDVVVYFMANLSRTASQFFISLFVLWIMTLVMYSFFRALGSWTKSLDIASRFTGVAIQILIVYTGYLIPPTKMHPWFKWLIWVNPVQYGFEALMANEFYNLEIECVPPYLVPQGPGSSPQYQSCLIQGSQPGQPTVNGASYILTAFTYRRSHLWRNVGIIIAFWVFFVILTMIGMEVQKPSSDGGAVTIFKRGQVPKHVSEAMTKGSLPQDEEKAASSGAENLHEQTSTSSNSEQDVKGIAKNKSVFTFTNVNYSIPYEKGERKLLSDVQGYVRPGKLTALMGSSGAGKTTLLNALAQRINFGVVTGDFLIDGRSLPKSFQRATGFAEQQDVHEPTATIREALQFSALLRQPKEVPIEEKYEYCEKIIDLLEMRDIAGATIGKVGVGLNQEQRKRVTIGVELASKPELLLFLDEPTSGLDSAAAFNIIRFLRKLADSGQALLVTIHQPSAVLFEHFDELILLKSGGRIVYHGELGKDSRILIDYFERNGAPKCPPRANPAEYQLEAIGAGNPDYDGQDWADVWASSPEYAERSREIQSMIETRRSAAESILTDDREYAMPLGTQVWAVVYRSFASYWRTPEYMVGKFMLHIVTGLFNTFTFYHVGFSQIDMQSRLFSIFLTLTISPPLIQQLQPKYLNFRNIYSSREANSKIYSWVAFTTGAILVEIPYSILAGTIYFQCWWWGAIGHRSNMFDNAFTWMTMMLFELYYVGFGQAIASFAPNELLASILVPIFFLFVVSFCGVVVPFAALPHFWQSWMYAVTPFRRVPITIRAFTPLLTSFRYILSCFMAVGLHGRPVICAPNEFGRFPPPPGQTCESYTQAFIAKAGGYVQNGSDGLCEFCQYSNGDEFLAGFNIFYNKKWLYYGVCWIFCIANFVMVYLFTWLYLGGTKTIVKSLSPAARKQKKAAQIGNEKA